MKLGWAVVSTALVVMLLEPLGASVMPDEAIVAIAQER